MSEDKFIDIWTDGSCPENGKRGAQGGWALYLETNISEIKLTQYSKTQKNATNNICEIKAILQAEKLVNKFIDKHGLKGEVFVTLYTDSMYVKNALDSWIRGWVRNGWMTKKKQPVENKDLFKELWSQHVKLKRASILKIVHVRSHQKEPFDHHSEEYRIWNGNDIADKLARAAAD